MDIFAIAARLGRHWPAGANLLLGRVVRALIPLTAGMGLHVKHNEPGRTVLGMPLRRRTRNHVGSIYFGALASLAEITMGLLVFTRYPPGPYGVLVKRAELDFLAKAKSDLTAVCQPDDTVFEELNQQLGQDGKGQAWFPVSVLDRRQAEVARARFLVAVKDFAHR